VEHAIFRGSDTWRSDELVAAIEGEGGWINGFTNYDFAGFVVTMPASAFAVASDILGDVLARPRFDQDALRKEQHVILEEIKLRDSNHQLRLHEQVFHALFADHPYGRSVIGDRRSVRRIRRSDLARHHEQFYGRAGVELVVVGDVVSADVLRKLEESFSRLPDAGAPGATASAPDASPKDLRIRLKWKSPQSCLCWAWPAPRFGNPDSSALALWSTILTGSPYARLSRPILHERQLVTGLHLSTDAMVQSGSMMLTAHTTPDRASQVESLLDSELRRALDQPISDDELEKAKIDYRFGRLSRIEHVDGIASQIAYDAGRGDADWDRVRAELLDSFTADQVLEAARRHLGAPPVKGYLGPATKERAPAVAPPAEIPGETLETADPFGSAPAAVTRRAPLAGEPQRFSLPSGATLIVQEMRHVPRVAIRAATPAGSRFEAVPASAAATAIMVRAGFGGHSRQELSEWARRQGVGYRSACDEDDARFWIVAPPAETASSVRLLGSMFREPDFPEDEWRRTQSQLIADIERRDDDMQAFGVREARRALYSGHPYEREAIGDVESVQKVQLDDLREFHGNWYRPERLIIAVVGDVDTPQVCELMAEQFPTPSGHDDPLPPVPELAPLESVIRSHHQKDWPAAVTVLVWRTPPLCREDFAAWAVLATLLGGAGASRLPRTIREERGLAYAAGAHCIFGAWGGALVAFAGVRPRRIPLVSSLILSEVARLRTEPVDAEELDRVKRLMRGSNDMGHQGSDALAGYLLAYESYGWGYEYDREHSRRIEEVTPEHLQALASTLGGDNYLELVIRPKRTFLGIALQQLLKGGRS